jgi:hypothetical protein
MRTPVVRSGTQRDLVRPFPVLRRRRPVHAHDLERRVCREEELVLARHMRGRDEVHVVAATHRVELDPPEHARIDEIVELRLPNAREVWIHLQAPT